MLAATRNGNVWNEFFICTPIKTFRHAQHLIQLYERDKHLFSDHFTNFGADTTKNYTVVSAPKLFMHDFKPLS